MGKSAEQATTLALLHAGHTVLVSGKSYTRATLHEWC